MMGNVFAGCTESPGELIKIGERYYKPFRGMGSKTSRAKRFSLDRYSHSPKGIAEGVEGFVPYRGDVEAVVSEFSEGLSATMGYTGARNVKEMWNKAKFGLVSAIGIQELSPHDIVLPGN
jgi:IMP dehydrogenase